MDQEPIEPRSIDEGRKVVEAVILCALFVESNLPPDNADDHEGIKDAVMWALNEAGYEDQEALQSTAMRRFEDTTMQAEDAAMWALERPLNN